MATTDGSFTSAGYGALSQNASSPLLSFIDPVSAVLNMYICQAALLTRVPMHASIHSALAGASGWMTNSQKHQIHLSVSI
jgi:hypothetical protein